MPVEITMPKLGLTMATGTIARWHKGAGDAVKAGEPLLEVATDKITYEVEAPASGVLGRITGGEGAEYACGEVLAVITAAGETDAPVAPAPLPAPAAPAPANGAARIIASPAARRLARERSVPIAEIRGSGPRGRITLFDVHAYRSAAPAAAPAPAAVATADMPAQLPANRRAIFKKMTAVALIPLAQVETHVTVDAAAALLEVREIGWTAFAVYAVARLLARHPDLRTDARTGAPVAEIDIGLAADTPHGLIVPVVRGANRLDLAATQAEIVRLAADARAGRLGPDAVGGACFSISNVGPQRVERVSPLPDPPQTAILGMGAATLRPAVVDGVIAAARVIDLILSFDHRFIDGAPAARFLSELAAAFRQPATLL